MSCLGRHPLRLSGRRQWWSQTINLKPLGGRRRGEGRHARRIFYILVLHRKKIHVWSLENFNAIFFRWNTKMQKNSDMRARRHTGAGAWWAVTAGGVRRQTGAGAWRAVTAGGTGRTGRTVVRGGKGREGWHASCGVGFTIFLDIPAICSGTVRAEGGRWLRIHHGSIRLVTT